MPTIELSKKELETYIGKKIETSVLKERISYLGTDLEGIDGNTITVEIFPNRPDLLSQPGFSRAIGYFAGVHKHIISYKAKKSDYKIIVESAVSSVRPYTACAVVKKLTFDDQKIKEIIQIQEKLHITFGRNRKKCAIGVYPLEKITFPITYTAKRPKEIRFIPLEEKKVMSADEILTQTATGRQYAKLLEGQAMFPLFQDRSGEILSMPPIINSHTVGKVTEKTRDLFIECSGHDYQTVSECLNMIVCSLADMGGEIYEVKVQYKNATKINPELAPKKMKIDYALINKRLGIKLNTQEIKSALLKMGIGTLGDYALIPPYRTGFFSYADLVEEVAIGYGYENFLGSIPPVSTTGEEAAIDAFRRRVTETILGLGFTQAETLHLLPREKINGEAVELLDAKSSEFNTCRNEMITPLLLVLQNNRMYEYPQKIFESGTVIMKKGKDISEKELLSCAIADLKADYTSIRQVAGYLLKRFGIDAAFKETKDSTFIEGRAAKIILLGKEIGRLGEIHPHVLSELGLETPVAVLEIGLTPLFDHTR